MKYIKLFEQFVKEATRVTPESDVDVDDYLMDDAETTIKSTEIVGAIVSSETEKDFKDYFYDTYGNTAFTENDIQNLVKYFNEYKEEKNAEETEKEEEEKKKEEGDSGDDPLAGLDV